MSDRRRVFGPPAMVGLPVWDLGPRRADARSLLAFRRQPMLTGLAVAVGYFIWRPAAPDLAAQTAWAALVHRSGLVPVFARWYGGIPVGGYSVLAPVLMGAGGVVLVGALAGLAAVVLAGPLFRASRSPMLGLSVFATCDAANLLSGRVTFGLGLAAGAGVLLAVSRSRPVWAALIACLTCLASPVAGLFLLVPLAAVVWCDPQRRKAAAAAAVAAAVTLAVLQVAFPLGGYEPFDRRLLLISLAVQLGAAMLPVGRTIRVAVLLGAAALVATYFAHTALGGNIARLPVLITPGAVVAQLALGRRYAVAVAAVLCIYPIAQASTDVVASSDPSANQAFTSGLEQRLVSDPVARTHRIEVVDAGTHWGTVRLTNAGLSMARGWITQVDQSENPSLYGRAPLTAVTYRSFLDRTASGYVAVEHGAPLDAGAKAESVLVRQGLPYLTAVWSDRFWTLYTVTDPVPVVHGVASLLRLTDTGAVLEVTTPGRAQVDVNWSPYLTVDGGRVMRSGRTVSVEFTSPGLHTLRAAWPWNASTSAPPAG